MLFIILILYRIFLLKLIIQSLMLLMVDCLRNRSYIVAYYNLFVSLLKLYTAKLYRI